MSIVETAQQKRKSLEVILTDCQPYSDLIAISHDNLIIHINNTRKWSNDQTREVKN